MFARLFVLIVAFVTCGVAVAAVYPLKLSSDGRYLADQSGQPFIINGDAPWSLTASLSKPDTVSFLDARSEQGINALIVQIVQEDQWGGPLNSEGHHPFSETWFGARNELYWSHVDWLIDQADQRGMVIFAFPAYIGYGCSHSVTGTFSQGLCGRVNDAGAAAMRSYGEFLGDRYKDRENIVWVMGGDWPDDGVYQEHEALVAGIDARDPNHLISAHCNRLNSALDCYDRSWLDLNNTYANCGAVESESRNDYLRGRAFFFIEGTYDGEGATQECVRGQAYVPTLSGASGHFYGNNPVYSFASGWQSALSGADTLLHFSNLFASRPRVTPSDLVAGAIDASGPNTIVAYTNGSITADLSALNGTEAQVWWFDPRTGQATGAGVHPKVTTQFNPPASGDWVFVADNADLNRSPPGQGLAAPAPTPPSNLTVR